MDRPDGVAHRLLDVPSEIEVARERGVDIAFLIPDPAVHAAVQHLRRERASWPLAADWVALAESLAKNAVDGGLALLLGAGVSIAAGLPSWSDLLEELNQHAGAPLSEKTTEELGPLDVAELLRRRLRDAELAERVPRACTTTGHALARSLLVALGCREVVTTNYDRCYEAAADIGGDGDAPAVLPWVSATDGQSWLLKMHGDVEHPESIVLSRRHSPATTPRSARPPRCCRR